MFGLLKKKKLGLCLGGGAARGYSLIPIIQKLSRDGVVPDAVSGASIGSIIGAYYCLNGEVDSLLEEIKKMSKKDFAKLIDLNNPTKSAIKGRRIKKLLQDKFFGNKTFDDLKIPLVIVATDIASFTPVYFTKGKLIDAIMASSSIPGIFPPYKIDGKLYIDGGVSKHIPYKILFTKFNVKKVVAVDLVSGVSKTSKDTNEYNIVDILFGAFYAILRTAKIEDIYKKKVFLLIPR